LEGGGARETANGIQVVPSRNDEDDDENGDDDEDDVGLGYDAEQIRPLSRRFGFHFRF